MKRTIVALAFSFVVVQAFSQASDIKNTYLKLSFGRVSFGTGDFPGYSCSFDGSRNVVKKSSWGLHKLLLGAELFFENGVKNPVIQNPTPEAFLNKTFRQTSNIIFWPKAAYYPIKKVLPGFHLQLGPTVGYSYRSMEAQARRVVDASGNSIRQSILSFENGFTVGYRISTGIEFDISRKFLAGIRLDFSNNNEAEINTLAALKAGIKL